MSVLSVTVPFGRSLRSRLPLFVGGVIVAALAIAVWAAHVEMQRTLLAAARDRAQVTADALIHLFGPSIQQTYAAHQRTAADPIVAAFVADPNADSAQIVTHLRRVLGGGELHVELWRGAGQRALAWSSNDQRNWPVTSAPPASPDTIVEIDGGIFFQRSTPVRRGDAPIGYLVARRRLTLTPPDLLKRLLGNATASFGPRAGDAWTDFETLKPRPAADSAPASGAGEYRDAQGNAIIGALADVSGTPFAFAVEFSRAAVIAPADAFLGRMLIVGALVIVAAGLMVSWITGRITTPLFKMSRAAEAIAGGDYSRRVNVHGEHEIGALGEAFDAMAAHVEHAQRRLEQQVRERSDALEALRDSDLRHRAVVEVALDPLIIVDAADGRVVEFNPAAERTFGFSRAEAINRELAALIVPPALRERHRRGLAQYARSGESRIMNQTIELTAVRADGSEFPVELALTPIPSEHEALVVGVVRDITQRKQVSDILAESERAYRSTFDEAPVGIAHMALDGPFLRVNKRLTALLGYTADELMTIDPSALIDPAYVPQRNEQRRRLLAGIIDRVVDEVPYQHRDGHLVTTQVAFSLHRDATGAPMYFIAIIEDVSDRRHLESRLRQSQKMEAVGQLAGGIAHDFNNLLTAILGFSALLLEDTPESDPRRRFLMEIEKAGQSAASLTGQLLAFSRRQILMPSVLDLNATVSGMEVLLRRLIGEDIDLVLQLDPGLDRVSADAGQIEQVVLNLALNARDAMPTGGKLTIETRNVDLDDSHAAAHPTAQPGRHVMLAVHDTGHGMDAQTRGQIFEPFFTTKQRGEGTGLGLATVYGIVKQSGGWIWVDSTPGVGTTFRIDLPPTALSEGSTTPDRPAPTLGGTETILVAEDQADVRAVTAITLSRSGYHVLEAASGAAALRVVGTTASPIHLLLTDVVMPHMSGRELAEAIKASHPDIRVLFASGYTDDAVVRHGVVETGLHFIQKPFTPAALLLKVRQVLDA